MEQTKDYSLLRPFDLEAAKAGALLGDAVGSPTWEYAAGPDSNGNISVIIIKTGLFAEPSPTRVFKMAPLCWAEGRPVYRGDTLYFDDTTIDPGRAFIVENGNASFAADCEGNSASLSRLTWHKPTPVLCEVEGKPVRKGDRIWSNFFKRWFTVTGKVGAIKEVSLIDEQDCYTLASSCSWKRKVITRGFINIYARTPSPSAIAATGPCVYKTHEAATKQASQGLIATIPVEWTEEVEE